VTDANELDRELADRCLARLGFAEPPATDLDGLSVLYGAWCRDVPFDNVRKLIALHRPIPGPLPGLDVNDFFRSWLDHGVGGTCWPSSHALYSLIAHCGFTTRPLAASMYDAGIASHGTTVVVFDDDEWLVDSSMLFGVPLCLDPSGPTTIDDPTFRTTAEPVVEGWLFGFPKGNEDGLIPCRTITPGAVDVSFYAARYEWSRENSPFNEQVNMRRNRGDSMVTYGGGVSLVRSGADVETTELVGEELHRALVDEMGLSASIVEQLAAAVDLS
jgi:arylamine N-acetyltransferase